LGKRPSVNGLRRFLDIALSSGLGRNAFVFDDDDVVHLLRAVIEREGGQAAFAKHHGIALS
jgi:hypothetical protein